MAKGLEKLRLQKNFLSVKAGLRKGGGSNHHGKRRMSDSKTERFKKATPALWKGLAKGSILKGPPRVYS